MGEYLSMPALRRHVLIVCLLMSTLALGAENASKSLGEPVLETPTLRCLGVYWLIEGDDNRNASVEFHYKKHNETEWMRGPNLFRVERLPEDHFKDDKGKPRVFTVMAPRNGWLFAGSIFLLDPDTAYDLKLNLVDPDGGSAEKSLTAHTIGEPIAPQNMPQLHVVPGSGGGTGTASDPFKGLEVALKVVKPGDLVLLHAGRYTGEFPIGASGEEGKPIIFRGAGDGETILDGGAPRDKVEASHNVVGFDNKHDLWFEKLSVRGGHNLFRGHGAYRIVIRRCHIFDGIVGVFAVGDDTKQLGRFFIADNLFEGVMPWPTTPEEYGKLPESRAVWMGGTGNVVCFNRFNHWKDGIDMADCRRCDSNDFHNNDVSECFDDGTELDGSDRNTRCFLNRYTNVFQGISFQPIYGGPAYAFRNVLYNCQVEPFKLHNGPSGSIMIHNTIVRNGPPTMVMTGEPQYNAYARNNLFIGTQGRALHYDCPNIDCDYDFDGFAGVSGDVFLKWNNIKYPSLDEVRKNCPVEKHCTVVDNKTVFASGLLPPDDNKKIFERKIVDLRLKEGSAAIDAGEVLPGFNDGFTGKAPDLGAYEFGSELPQYGIRPEK
jgi:hypothetical protein